MKKMFFVMNPRAGQRKACRYLAQILAEFNRGGYEVSVYMTACPGDGIQAVAKRAKDVDLIVCCGGDGTFNETVTGLLQAGVDVPLGYIPAGSTNDFAASLHLPTHPVKAAQAILAGKPVAYDVGRFGQRYFAYVASFGAFTRASYATPQGVKNVLGHAAYVLEGITELTQIHKTHVRLELDGGKVVEDDFIFGAISNSTSVGGVLTLDARQVDMRDGLFELLLIRPPRDLSELGECIKALRTHQYNCRMITFLSASSVQITADPNMCWTLDGEREEGHDRVQVQNLHHAIRLIQRIAP